MKLLWKTPQCLEISRLGSYQPATTRRLAGSSAIFSLVGVNFKVNFKTTQIFQTRLLQKLCWFKVVHQMYWFGHVGSWINWLTMISSLFFFSVDFCDSFIQKVSGSKFQVVGGGRKPSRDFNVYRTRPYIYIYMYIHTHKELNQNRGWRTCVWILACC